MRHTIAFLAVLAASRLLAQQGDGLPGSGPRYVFTAVPISDGTYYKSLAGGLNHYFHVAHSNLATLDQRPHAFWWAPELNNGLSIKLADNNGALDQTRAEDVGEYSDGNGQGEDQFTVHDEYVVGSGVVPTGVRQPVLWIRAQGTNSPGNPQVKPVSGLGYGVFLGTDPVEYDPGGIHNPPKWEPFAVGKAASSEAAEPLPAYWYLPAGNNSRLLPPTDQQSHTYFAGEALAINTWGVVAGYVKDQGDNPKIPCTWTPTWHVDEFGQRDGTIDTWALHTFTDSGWPADRSGAFRHIHLDGRPIGTAEGSAQAFSWWTNEQPYFSFLPYTVEGVRTEGETRLYANLDNLPTSYFVINPNNNLSSIGPLGRFYNDVDGLRAHEINGEEVARMQILYDIALDQGYDWPLLLMRSSVSDNRLHVGYHVERETAIPQAGDITLVRGLALGFLTKTLGYDNDVSSITRGSYPPNEPAVQFTFSAPFDPSHHPLNAFTATFSGRISIGGSFSLWMEVWNYATQQWEPGDLNGGQLLVEPIGNNWKSFRIRLGSQHNLADYFSNNRPLIRVSAQAGLVQSVWALQVDHLRFDRES